MQGDLFQADSLGLNGPQRVTTTIDDRYRFLLQILRRHPPLSELSCNRLDIIALVDPSGMPEQPLTNREQFPFLSVDFRNNCSFRLLFASY